jgi:hypothetical protein
MAGVAMSNYAKPEQNGHSVAYDGIAFDDNEQSVDTTIVEVGEEEGIYLAVFDLGLLRDYRKREVWGNSYRKPKRYAILASPAVEPPFVRSDSRR